jgi:heme/copper-type cytochrome/quinol oxidase subunit 4
MEKEKKDSGDECWNVIIVVVLIAVVVTGVIFYLNTLPTS